MAYTRRTCNQCGYKDIQPRMVQREITYESGRSKRSVGATTVLGAMLGDDKSARAVTESILNTQGRKYYRKKLIWLCGECSGVAANERKAAEDAVKKEQLARDLEVRRKASLEAASRLKEERRLRKAQRERDAKARAKNSELLDQYLRNISIDDLELDIKEAVSASILADLHLDKRGIRRLKSDATRHTMWSILKSFAWCVATFVLFVLASIIGDSVYPESKGWPHIFALLTTLGIPTIFTYNIVRAGRRKKRAIKMLGSVAAFKLSDQSKLSAPQEK